jgi:hypothetical protein
LAHGGCIFTVRSPPHGQLAAVIALGWGTPLSGKENR